MRKVIDFLRSKDPILVAIKCFLALVVIAAICENVPTRIGKGALIFIAITSPINIIALILMGAMLAIGFFLLLSQMLTERNETRRKIFYVFIAAFSVFIFYDFISDPYQLSISSKFRNWIYTIHDLKNGETEQLEDVEIFLSRFPGSTGRNYSIPTTYSVSVYQNDKTVGHFSLSSKDYYEIGKMSLEYERFNIEFYKKSNHIKSIEPIIPEPEPEPLPEPPVPDTVELWLESSRYDDMIILVCRPEIEGYDDYNKNISDDNFKRKLYWYVTKNGEYYKCLDAYKGSCSTTFLSFEKSGEYTVTLVINYNVSTGEYTPISNTLEYTIE